MKKSILSLFLALCMVLSMLPVTTFAASVVESAEVLLPFTFKL